MRLKHLKRSDVEDALGNDPNPQQEKEYIEQWVSERLWAIEARKNISPTRSLKKMVRNYRNDLLVRQYKEDMILNKIMISENDVLEYYEKNKDDFRTEESAALINVCVCQNSETANAVKNAFARSENPPVHAQRQLVYRGTCIDPLDEKIFSRYPKDMIGPVLYKGEYYVVSVLERYSPNSLLRVEHVREDIIQKLRMTEYINAVQTKEKELKERINVKILKNTDN